jgi:hypothetical protein
MSAESETKPKPKLGQRIIRAFVVGNLLGIVLMMLFVVEGGIMAHLGFTVLSPTDMGMLGWAVAVSGAEAIELSKDMD